MKSSSRQSSCLAATSRSVSEVFYTEKEYHSDLELQVIISSHNALEDGRYFDVESSSSFSFDHTTQKASNASSYVLEGAQTDLVYVIT